MSFLEDVLCPVCRGYGIRPMNEPEKRERGRVLRMAKRQGKPMPDLDPIPCEECHQLGYVKETR